MTKAIQAKISLWDRLKLRGRLLAMMLIVALAAVLICTVSFSITYYRMVDISRGYAQVLSGNVHRMVEMAFYQQETYIRHTYTVSQANLLDRRLSELSEQGKAPDWSTLLAEAYDLINNTLDAAEGYEGPGKLDDEGATIFIWADEKFYAHGVDGGAFTQLVDNFYAQLIEQGNVLSGSFIENLTAWKSNMTYTKGENGVLQAWYSFGEGEYRIGIFVPNTGALAMSTGLQELMVNETNLALEKMNTAVNKSIISLLVAIGVLLLALPLASRRLALVVVNPFELEQERQRNLLRITEDEKDVLELVSKAKTEFLSNTSHEMRTPLTVISVNVQTVAEMLNDMGEAVKNTEAAELLQNAQQEIMRLARMVGGMLTLASMSEKTDKQEVDFSALLHSSTEMFALHMKKQGNVLKSDIAQELSVFGNADLLAQLVANLLQNASTHTQRGEIILRGEKIDNEIIVTVADTGTGISAEFLPNVFERGVSTRGTGFGLYLCKTVVESHGGRIGIESTQGKGTTVIFSLPTYEGQFGGEKS